MPVHKVRHPECGNAKHISDLLLRHARLKNLGCDGFPVHAQRIVITMYSVNRQNDVPAWHNPAGRIARIIMHVGHRIKVARKRLGWSQDQLARAVGTVQGVISGIESGKQKSTTQIVELAHALRVRPLWLARGEGPMESQPGDNPRDEALMRVLDAWECLTEEQRQMFAKLVHDVAD